MDLQTAIIFLAVLLGLFFIGRNLMLWYWKTDKRLSLMERQNVLLEEQNQHLSDIVRMNHLLLAKQVEKIQIEDITGKVKLITPQEWSEEYRKDKQIKVVNVR